MLKQTVATTAGRPVILMDSITKVEDGDAGAIVVSGSHGGTSSGEIALRVPLTCVVFNDAGVGKDRAGVAALAMLEERGVAGATVAHTTGRIGDAADMWENGIVSFVNPAAVGLGLRTGDRLKDAVARIGTVEA
ncbi:hypothetical protein DLJ53_27125 [Acuticoccus sediminis]|uniref:Uncharacterized protein n=1 Tax=Acuticoccus sediminis TaxID=2184697 RepID=A0A8B2NSL7_9HYPH|nr:hypothetical protein [Acuticoccus sediminis]RAH98372.1 hypothetical protein DLJ53_27125 [Acuticoccus sediminis]